MRNGRRIVTLGVAALLMGVTAPIQAGTAQAADAPQVQLEGTIERLADTGAHASTALRLTTGERLPLAPLAAAPTGGRVRVLLPVPASITDSVAAGRALPGATGAVTKADLEAAASTPAESSSALAQAVVHAAIADGKPVNVTSVQVFSQAMAATATTAIPAVHDITVAIVRPKGVNAPVATASQVAAQVRGADAYWREQSRGKVSLRLASTSSPYQSAFSCQDDPFRMWTEAARATGFREGANKHLVMVLPREALKTGCSYGLASMGQTLNTGGIAYVADTAWPVLAHELGHNLGLAHAKSFRSASVTDASLTSGRGTVEEYGDPFDVMAASPRDNAGSLSIPQAVRIGLVGSNEYVDAAAGTRTVTLSAVSTLRGVRAVRVQDPRNGAVYWVEYRTRTRRDAKLYRPMAAGVRILREDVSANNPWASTVALDASPSGSASDTSWALPVAHRFTSYGQGVEVTVTAVRGESATVVIRSSASGVSTAAGRVGRIGRPAAVKRATVAAPSVKINSRGVVSWSAKGATRYDVVTRTVRGKKASAQRTWFASTARKSATITGRKGTTIQIKVRAKNSRGAGAWSGWKAVAFR